MRTFIALAVLFLIPALQAAEPLPSYLVVAPEGMEEPLVARVQSWMERNLHYPVRVQRLPDWEAENGKEQITAVLAQIGKPGMVTVILSNRLPDGQHALVDPERMAGVVNVPLLAPEINETTFRRLERQAMRIVGFSMEIPPQPIPFCCLFPYKTMDQLDAMGRGFSPPAMGVYRNQLQAKGFPLSPEAEKQLPKVNLKPIPPLPSEE